MRRALTIFALLGLCAAACRGVLGIDENVGVLSADGGDDATLADAAFADGEITAGDATTRDARADGASPRDAGDAGSLDAALDVDATPIDGGFCYENPGHSLCEDFDEPGLASRWDAVTNITVASGETTSDPNALLASSTAAKDAIQNLPSVVTKTFAAGSHVVIRASVRIDVNPSEANTELLRLTFNPPPPGFGRYFIAVGGDIGFPPDLIYSVITDAGITFDRASTKQDFAAFHVLLVDIDQKNAVATASVDGVQVATLGLPPFAPEPFSLSLGVTYLDNGGNNSPATFTTRIDDVLVDSIP